MYHNVSKRFRSLSRAKMGRLQYMGGEDQRSRGPTKRFTREELTELADKARGERPRADDEPAPVQLEVTPMSRAQTVHDPMTTQLLAEVARRPQTVELDAEDAFEDDDTETAHPHLRRRS